MIKIAPQMHLKLTEGGNMYFIVGAGLALPYNVSNITKGEPRLAHTAGSHNLIAIFG